MSKRQFKAQASSGRAGGGGFGAFGSAGFGSTHSSVLSYIQEPPDFALISDGNLVVAFKNLCKKDSTTKAKALEDLQAALISAEGEVEDAIVETWVKLYPRLSIDGARRVRQLAHTLNGQLSAKCGKRIARHLPRVSGPWLAGTFDVDRAAAKAASDALSSVFSSPEKIQGLRKTFQESVLEYCRAAVLDETVQTLSDERTVSADDAASTYARVISGALALISSLLETLPSEETDKQSHVYDLVFDDGKTWEFPSHSDASIRRAMHRLVQTCVKHKPALIENNLKHASKAYIYEGLPSDQIGSALDFAQTLSALTASYPSVWTEAYSGERPAITWLQQGLKRGAHSGPAGYWDVMAEILRKLPKDVLPKAAEEATDFLVAARDGVARKEERFNASSAWLAYFTLVDIVTSPLSEDDTESLLEAFAMPPVNQYLQPSEESSIWTISGAKAASLVSQIGLVKRISPLLERKWSSLGGKLTEIAKMSQPEQSKEFETSQRHVAATGERWAGLQRELLYGPYDFPESTRRTFVATNSQILHECTTLLRARRGKPYGAAAILEEQLRACYTALIGDADFRKTLVAFLAEDVPGLIFSPSQRHLSRCLYALSSASEFASLFQNTLHSILNTNESSDAKLKALHSFFPPNTPRSGIEMAQSSRALQSLLRSLHITSGDSATLALLADLLKLGAMSSETTDTLLSSMTQALSAGGSDTDAALTALDRLAVTDQPILRTFVESEAGKNLLPSILRLEQSPEDGIAERATFLSGRLTSAMGAAATDAKYSVVLQNLETASSSSLSIEAVLELVNKIPSGNEGDESTKDILPNLEQWQDSLRAVMRPLKGSLSLLSALGGVLHIVNEDRESASEPAQYDAEGLSQALRIAVFLARLMNKPGAISRFGDNAVTILAVLNICVLIAEDNTSILGANALWLATENLSVEVEVMDFVSDANAALRQYWESLPSDSGTHEQSALLKALDDLRVQNPMHSEMTYYACLAATKARENIFELHGYSSEQARSANELLRSSMKERDALTLTSLIVGHAQPLTGSPALVRLCNELVADLTELKLDSNPEKGLESLALLNGVLRTQDDIATNVQKTRLIFFAKHVILWLVSDASLAINAEICKALTFLLPTLSDVYGEHWAQVIDFLATFWSSVSDLAEDGVVSESGILMIHSSLKLYDGIHRLSQTEEPNDDLVEALKESRGQLHNGLLSLLKASNGVSDETHQPLMITNELLARELARVPFKPLADAEELFGLLYTPSHAVQGAAFDLLHRQIPAAQEQISFDAALDDKTAELPDELLSLLIDPPTLDSLADASFDRVMPLPLKGFLYSWRLLFDHFTNSSFRVKSDYVEQLKKDGYLDGLLSLLFDFLGHTRGKPIDASKFDVQEYIPDIEPSPERDVQWLLTHLYYLALSNMQNLVIGYVRDVRSRQTLQAIESWTARYIAPLLIAASLQDVANWAEKSVKDDPDYENMTVKVSMRSREVLVSYLVDEQTMAIKVVLPETYPLDSAKVLSISRVAVKEEKWQSWLINCQGVIMFSNGSITDGLSAWRKNVIGALKGQTECAICYSIISADKQLPTKRCPTCKNLFHSGCLLKWFKTSNASTCPLCRNPFNFN